MKLIIMTDFVLEQIKNNNHKTKPNILVNQLDSIALYANFLKLPLTIGMFIPCDKNGNIIKKPDVSDFDNGVGIEYENFEHYKNLYKEAKNRVLFKGFEFVEDFQWGFQLMYGNNDGSEFIDLCYGDTIEDLTTIVSDVEFILTESAIRQLNL